MPRYSLGFLVWEITNISFDHEVGIPLQLLHFSLTLAGKSLV
jgi:hypothetical protein